MRAICVATIAALLIAAPASAQPAATDEPPFTLREAADGVLGALRAREREGQPLDYDFVFTISVWMRREFLAGSLAEKDRDARTKLAEEYATNTARTDHLMYKRLAGDTSPTTTAMTRYFALDAKRLLAEARGGPITDAPALLFAAESAYRRLDERRARGDPLTLPFTHAICFFSERWLQRQLAATAGEPVPASNAAEAHLRRLRLLSESIEEREDTSRVQRTVVRYFLETASGRVEAIRGGNGREHFGKALDAAAEHYEALRARERAGEPLTLEFVDLMHAASLRCMTASWLARPDPEDRTAAAQHHRGRMVDLRKLLLGIRDASPALGFAAEYYFANAQRIAGRERSGTPSPIDPLVD